MHKIIIYSILVGVIYFVLATIYSEWDFISFIIGEWIGMGACLLGMYSN